MPVPNVMMDGYAVHMGDTVYDVLYGTGTVVEILPTPRFRVNFPSRREASTYSDLGIQARYPNRTLFWRNPVLVVPLKDDSGWTKIKPIVDAVIAAFRHAV